MPATLPATPTSSAPHLHTTQATTTAPESSMFYQVQEEIDSYETDLSEMSSIATTSTTTPTTLSPQLHTTHTTNAASELPSTGQAAAEIDSNGTDLSPALYTTPTTPTTSATSSTTSDHEDHSIHSKSSYAEVLNLQSTPTSKSGATSATMSTTSNQQDHKTQMRSIHAGGSDLQITSTPISNSGNDTTTSFGTTAMTAAMARYKEITYPKISPLKSLPNWKCVSRIYPLNGQPDPAPATYSALAITTRSTTHDSEAASPTTPLDQTCSSISATSSSPHHLPTLTTSAAATTTTLPLDLHITTTATQPSTSEMSHLSPSHFNVSQPFHPGKLSRNQLPLDMKIEAIRLREEEGLSGRSIMEIMNVHGFKCGKTQVQNILKRKNEWIEQYAQNVPLSRKRKLRKTGNEEINHKVYEWFEEAIDRMIPVNGPMLQQKAVEIARELNITEFKGSNGWLESFRKRHSISFGKVNLGLEGGENPAGGLLPRKSYIFERAKSDPFGNDGKNLTSELPQMIVGEFVKNISSQSSSQTGVTEEKSSPNVSIMEPMFLKKKGNNWCKVKEEDVEKEEEEEEESQKEEDGGKKKEGKEGRGTLGHLKFKSIHHVAAALREMRIFFATRNYSHLLDSCLDLEEQVALESIAKRKTEEKSTVLDHLNPLDTRPSSNMEQP
ncbi:uncharacterized protein LOC100887902 [Strongylocentrotus purpuratus]|uniref:HTH CENPB-type domain-containing protein n=1 Tax=Strongylocentrotus purpuratus TaxID=7668 RepID=A0A7M7GJY5_STRPU|nr:uncharacterized protein LOC100887902 [Strongylocentrotus purpuratus]